jgi:carbon-monoxide dehydrogenase medium subunit
MRFGYLAPENQQELLAAVDGAARPVRVLAGGTWLIPLLRSSELEAATVVDLRVAGLDRIESVDGTLRIGAATTYHSLLESADITASAPLLGVMARRVTGGPQIRHQGTLGGSAAYANPSSDAPAVLAALDATFVIGSNRRPARRLEATTFFSGAFSTRLEGGDVLLSIEVPASLAAFGYHKLKFGESSWPVVTAAVHVGPNGGATIAVGAGFDRPVVARVDSEELISGPDLIARRIAGAAASSGAQPWSDSFADAAYRMAVLPVVLDRAIRDATTQGRVDGHDRT